MLIVMYAFIVLVLFLYFYIFYTVKRILMLLMYSAASS